MYSSEYKVRSRRISPRKNIIQQDGSKKKSSSLLQNEQAGNMGVNTSLDLREWGRSPVSGIGSGRGESKFITRYNERYSKYREQRDRSPWEDANVNVNVSANVNVSVNPNTNVNVRAPIAPTPEEQGVGSTPRTPTEATRECNVLESKFIKASCVRYSLNVKEAYEMASSFKSLMLYEKQGGGLLEEGYAGEEGGAHHQAHIGHHEEELLDATSSYQNRQVFEKVMGIRLLGVNVRTLKLLSPMLINHTPQVVNRILYALGLQTVKPQAKVTWNMYCTLYCILDQSTLNPRQMAQFWIKV